MYQSNDKFCFIYVSIRKEKKNEKKKKKKTTVTV